MQNIWSVNNRDNLLIFFSGWGMDEKPTAHLTADEYDVCTCFNYLSLETESPRQWKRYDNIVVVGWSMGVWAAEQVVSAIGVAVKKAIAINGTPKPVDNTWGIPTDIAQRTLEGLNPDSLKRFYRRMFGSAALMSQWAGALPEIDLEERKKELQRIVDAVPYPETGFTWNQAILSTNDAIFPPENLSAYWQGRATIQEIDAPHYPFHRYRSWEEVIGG